MVDVRRLLGAERYVTGLGALRYLDYGPFEAAAIRVEYMQYERASYPQLYGPLTPSVTILDCIANCGREGAGYIRSPSVYWKDFLGDG